jgi:hypothetical protein
VSTERVDLEAKLIYSNGVQVEDQYILLINPDSKRAIDENGNALFKVRVTEVSNKHRGQLFQVVVSARTRADVSPAFSVPVDVKSKRNSTNKAKIAENNKKLRG